MNLERRGWRSGIWVTESEQGLVTVALGILLAAPGNALPRGLLNPIDEPLVGFWFILVGLLLFVVSKRREEPADRGTRAYRSRWLLRHLVATSWIALGWWILIWVRIYDDRPISLTGVLLIWLGLSVIRSFYHDWIRKFWTVFGGDEGDYHPGSD